MAIVMSVDQEMDYQGLQNLAYSICPPPDGCVFWANEATRTDVGQCEGVQAVFVVGWREASKSVLKELAKLKMPVILMEASSPRL